MVSFVTVSGGADRTAVLGFNSLRNAQLANQLAIQISSGITEGTVVPHYDTDEASPEVPEGATGALIQTETTLAKLPYNYSIDLVTKSGPAIVFGSDSDSKMVLSDRTTDLTYFASSGSGTVVAGGGYNRISVSGRGDWLLNTANGNDLVAATGEGTATIGAGEGHNGILLGNGSDLVLSTGADTILARSGGETIDATGAREDLVQGNGSRLLFIGGSNGATIQGGTGSDTYFGSTRHAGKQLIIGGTGGDNLLMAGDGPATLIGNGGNDQLVALGSHPQLLVAGSSNETLSAALSSGPVRLRAGSGNDLLVGGLGSDTYFGGTGHTTVTAGYGHSVFEFVNHQAGGTELIQGILDPSEIKIKLQGYGPGAVAQALQQQTAVNGSVTIGLRDGTTITYQDVASLTRSNFN